MSRPLTFQSRNTRWWGRIWDQTHAWYLSWYSMGAEPFWKETPVPAQWTGSERNSPERRWKHVGSKCLHAKEKCGKAMEKILNNFIHKRSLSTRSSGQIFTLRAVLHFYVPPFYILLVSRNSSVLCKIHSRDSFFDFKDCVNQSKLNVEDSLVHNVFTYIISKHS